MFIGNPVNITGGWVTATAFAKEYHKKWSDEFDRHFLLILLLTAAIHFGTIGYFVANPLPNQIQQETIKDIQNRFATILLEREADNLILAKAMVERNVVRETAVPPQSEPGRQAEAEKNQPGGSENRTEQGQPAARQPAASSGPAVSGIGTVTSQPSRQQRRQQIEQQVANTGILALLSSNSPNAGNGAVQDIIGSGSEASQDYDRVFNNIDRVASSGRVATCQGSGGGAGVSERSAIKGERTTEGGRITTSISGIGASGAADMKRSSGFITSELAPLTSSSNPLDNEAVATGARDIDEVKAIVQAHTPAIEYCFQREKKRQPDLKGKIVVRFTILPNGTVKDPQILSSTLNNSSVERCILSRISRWDDFGEIDPSLGNATFRQVYTFGF